MVILKELVRLWEQELCAGLAAARSAPQKGAEDVVAKLVADVSVDFARLRSVGRGGRDLQALLEESGRFLEGFSWTPAMKRAFVRQVAAQEEECASLVSSLEKGLELSADEEIDSVALELLFTRDWLSRLNGWAIDTKAAWVGLKPGDEYPFDDRFRALLPDIDRLLGTIRSEIGQAKDSPWPWWERIGCLPTGTIASFMTGMSRDLVSVRRHIEDCSVCTAIAGAMEFRPLDAAALRVAASATHPSRLTLKRYLALNLAPPDRKLVDYHVKNCPECKSLLPKPSDVGLVAAAGIWIRIRLKEWIDWVHDAEVPSHAMVVGYGKSRQMGKERGDSGLEKVIWKRKATSVCCRILPGKAELIFRLSKGGELKVNGLTDGSGNKIPFRRIPSKAKSHWTVSFATLNRTLPVKVRVSLPWEVKEREIEIGG